MHPCARRRRNTRPELNAMKVRVYRMFMSKTGRQAKLLKIQSIGNPSVLSLGLCLTS